jgi:hypothetical protein
VLPKPSMGTRKSGHVLFFLLALIGSLALAGCTPSTRLVASWHDPSYRAGELRHPLVLAVTSRATVRAKLEDAFVRQLRAAGVDAMQSYKLVPYGEDPNLIATVKDKLPAAGRDSVLVTHLVDVKAETVFIPATDIYGTYGYSYPAYYDRLGAYYTHSYAVVAAPAYTYEYRTYELETNLYDAATDKLVWTVSTETEEGALDDVVKDFVGVVMKDVEKRGLF